MAYGSLCMVQSDCWPENDFDDCGKCCNTSRPRYRTTKCMGDGGRYGYEDEYFQPMSFHTTGTCP